MRYNVHPPRAFRNRIAKYLGVLVAAALIATLGLPSAAQAQSIANDGGIEYSDTTRFKINWTTNLDVSSEKGVNNWIVTITKPDGTKMVVNERSTVESTLGAVDTLDAEALGGTGDQRAGIMKRSLRYRGTALGIWWFQVSACFAELSAAAGTCSSANRESGTAVGYTHGAPAAPKNFAANAVPSGVALTWEDMTADRAISGYEYAFEMTAAGKPAWKPASGGAQVIKTDPGEHTFMLRALGSSDNDTSTTGENVPGMAASVTVTVPMPTPTLPEIAALFLAMLLLGSGAYLLRHRQSGGLTPA